MSRRREAAELARALELSTQQARAASDPSPHLFNSSSGHHHRSSGTSFTQDSRDLELRPFLPQFRPSAHIQIGALHAGAQPAVMTMAHIAPPEHIYGTGYGLNPTVRPAELMGPPAPGTGTESVVTSSGSGPRSSAHSDINSFPPSGTGAAVIIPATDSASRSGSGSGQTKQHSSMGQTIPSSLSHRRQPTSSIPPQTPAHSSPMPPGANTSSSRGSTLDKSHVSSTELSSNRPLFSPTQTSIMQTTAGSSRVGPSAPVITYGRGTRLTPSPQKARVNIGRTESGGASHEPIVLSSSPPSEPPARSPIRTEKRTHIALLSDEEEEEEKEPIEAPQPRSKVEVILPRKTPTSSASEKRISLEHSTRQAMPASSKTTSDRHVSPDPLDILNARYIETPTRPVRLRRSDETPAPAPTSSGTTSTAAASSATPSEVWAQNGGRRSSRVAEGKVKEELKKEEKRAERRARKEREKAKAEAKEKGIAGPSKLAAARVALPTDAVRESPRSRRGASPVVEVQADDFAEVEKQVEEPIMEIPDPRSSRGEQPKAKTTTESSNQKRKKRKSDADDFEGDVYADEGEEDDYNPSASSKSKTKAKAKKTKKEPVNKGKQAQVAKAVQPEVDVQADEGGKAAAQKEAGNEPEGLVEKAKVPGVEQESEPVKSPSPSPPPPEPVVAAPTSTDDTPLKRPPLRATSSNTPGPTGSPASFSHRPSPGPMTNGTPAKPGGINWKAPRNDLSSVLAKFGGAKRSGMSKRLKITPLHQKIGPPPKALPPVPKKPEKKKAGDDDDDDEDEDGDEDGEGGKKKKERGMEWYMVED